MEDLDDLDSFDGSDPSDWGHFDDDDKEELDLKKHKLEVVDEWIKSIFQPILETFSKEELDRALDDRVYLVEMTADVAPKYLMVIQNIGSRFPDGVLKSVDVDHVLHWMENNCPEKYIWFTTGDTTRKKKWLEWNINGYMKFILDED